MRQFQFKYSRAAFNGWKTHYLNTRKLVTSLSNLEKMMRDKISIDSFHTVRSFSVSKGLVYSERKKKGTEDLMSLVRNAYLKQLGIEF